MIQSLCCLPGGLFNFQEVCNLIKNTPSSHDIIKTYSSDIRTGTHTFYSYINKQLCNDNGDTLRKLMPLIRRATKQINLNEPDEECVVYRGMNLNSEQCDCFQIDTIFRFPGLTSTSKSEFSAKRFGKNLFKIIISPRCPQVKNMTDISCFPLEEEYLFSPYSRFHLIEKNGNYITLQAYDNLDPIVIPKRKPLPPPPPSPTPPLLKYKSDDSDCLGNVVSSICTIL